MAQKRGKGGVGMIGMNRSDLVPADKPSHPKKPASAKVLERSADKAGLVSRKTGAKANAFAQRARSAKDD